MRRVLLFLLLAVAGIGALAHATGGLLGNGTSTNRPQVATRAADAASDATRRPIRLGDLPSQGKGAAPSVQIDELDKLATSAPAVPKAWVDSVTGQRIEFTTFVAWHFSAQQVQAAQPTAPGDTGVAVRRIAVKLYREPSTFTRAEAEAQRMVAEHDGRAGPVAIEIEAEEGRADFLHTTLSGGERAPNTKTVVHLTKSVTIRDVEKDVVFKTAEATIDLDLRTAQGTGAIEAVNPAWVLRGQGFEMTSKDRDQRFRILGDADLDVRGPVSPPAKGGASVPSDFAPTHIRSRGGATFAQRTTAEGGYDVGFRDDVRAVQEGGRSLSADAMDVVFLRGGGTQTSGDAPGPLPATSGSTRVASLVARGHVILESPGEEQGSSLVLVAPSLAYAFAERGRSRMLCEGESTVTWTGPMGMTLFDDRASKGTLRARCTERLLFGPPEDPVDVAADVVLSLLGSAHVESWNDGPERDDVAPQVLDARVVKVRLRRTRDRAASPVSASKATSTSDLAPLGRLAAIAFTAEGGVRLDGPQVSGHADRLEGSNLDQPKRRLVATGSNPRLVVAEASPAAPRDDAGGGGAPASRPRDRRAWQPEEIDADHAVSGRLERGGLAGMAAPVVLAADRMHYDRERGARLYGRPDADASVVLEGANDHRSSVRAPTIGFLTEPDGRRLWTEGATRAVVYTADSDAPPPAPRASATPPSRYALSSRTRIQIDTWGGAERSVELALHDGASVERLDGGRTADHLEAAEIRATLVDRIVAPTAATSGASPTAKASPPPAPRAAGAKGAVARGDAPWTIASTRGLAVAFGAGAGGGSDGLRSLEAEGSVDLRDPTTHLEGERLAYDATKGAGTLTAAEGRRTRVSIGNGDSVDVVVAPAVAFEASGTSVRSATFSAPVAGVFHGEGATRGTTDRFVLSSTSGPLRVTPGGAFVDADGKEIVVTQATRAAKGAAWAEATRVATTHLAIEAPGLLGGGRAAVARLVATGPGSRVEVGAGADARRVMGDRIVYDRDASLVTITAAGGGRVHMVSDRMQGDFHEVSYDPATGALEMLGPDIEVEADAPGKTK